MNHSYKRYYLIGFVGFFGLIALATIFYKERMIFADAALYLFHIVGYQEFAIFHSRFISIAPQLLPVLAFKASLPLQAIAILYSVAFPLYALLMYTLCSVVGRSYRHSLVVLLFNVLLVTGTFYWMLSELALGVMFLMFFFSIIFRWQNNKVAIYLVLAASVPILVFAHPFILLPFSFMISYYWLRQDLSRRILIIATSLFIIVFIAKLLFLKDPYDKGSLGGLRNILTLFPNYFNVYSNKLFLYDCLRKYYWLPLLAIPVIYHYIRSKSFPLLILFLGYVLGCIFFVNVCFPYKHTPYFYRENLYLILSVFIAIPFIDEILPRLNRRRLGGLILTLIIVTGLLRIYLHHPPFTQRIHFLQSYLSRYGNDKIIIKETKAAQDSLFLTWATPYEFWLLSTIEQGQTASLLITKNPDSLAWATYSSNQILFTWGFFDYNELPRKYFMLEDSVSKYRIMR